MPQENSASAFLTLVRCAMLEEKPPLAFDSVNWDEVLALSKAHSLDVMLAYPVLELAAPGSALFSSAMRTLGGGLAKQQAQQEGLKEIALAFTEAKIPFLPLKGSVLRELYPHPEMRTMCDLDILVHPEDSQRGGELLKKLGYTQEEGFDHDVPYTRLPYLHVELHYRLVAREAGSAPLLEQVWEHARPLVPGGMEYRMEPEWMTLYLTLHFAKHFVLGGSGFRSVVDLWLYDRKVPCDTAKRDALLEQGGVLVFYRRMMELAGAWGCARPIPKELEETLGYLLTSGVYGNFGNLVAGRLADNESSLARYWLKRVFPPYSVMRYRIPWTDGRPWLLPAAHVARWAQALAQKKEEKVEREAAVVKQVSASQIEQRRALLKQTGLEKIKF